MGEKALKRNSIGRKLNNLKENQYYSADIQKQIIDPIQRIKGNIGVFVLTDFDIYNHRGNCVDLNDVISIRRLRIDITQEEFEN